MEIFSSRSGQCGTGDEHIKQAPTKSRLIFTVSSSISTSLPSDFHEELLLVFMADARVGVWADGVTDGESASALFSAVFDIERMRLSD